MVQKGISDPEPNPNRSRGVFFPVRLAHVQRCDKTKPNARSRVMRGTRRMIVTAAVGAVAVLGVGGVAAATSDSGSSSDSPAVVTASTAEKHAKYAGRGRAGTGRRDHDNTSRRLTTRPRPPSPTTRLRPPSKTQPPPPLLRPRRRPSRPATTTRVTTTRVATATVITTATRMTTTWPANTPADSNAPRRFVRTTTVTLTAVPTTVRVAPAAATDRELAGRSGAPIHPPSLRSAGKPCYAPNATRGRAR